MDSFLRTPEGARDLESIMKLSDTKMAAFADHVMADLPPSTIPSSDSVVCSLFFATILKSAA